MFTWGWNQNSQLGHGDQETRIVPALVKRLDGVVASGSSDSSGRIARSVSSSLDNANSNGGGRGIVRVACGSRFTVALTAAGTVYTWGRGDDSQLGHSRGTGRVASPRLVEALVGVKIVQVSARGNHVAVADDAGAMYVWGKGNDGQLGLGSGHNRKDAPTPVRVSFGNDDVRVARVACSRVHTVAVSSDGDLFSWGSGEDGANGLGAPVTVWEPTRVEGLEGKVCLVACGSRHTVISLMPAEGGANILLTFGWNLYSQLGLGDTENRSSPTEVSLPAELTHHVEIACGFRHTLLVARSSSQGSNEHDHQLWSWGWNLYGQLGFKTSASSVPFPRLVNSVYSRVTALAGGGRHTVAVLERARDGALRMYAWGRGDEGQLGTGELAMTAPPKRVKLHSEDVGDVACGWSHSAAARKCGDAPLVRRLTHEDLDGAAFKRPTFSSILKERATFEGVISGTKKVLSAGNLDAGFAQLLNCLILFLLMVHSLKLRAGFADSLVRQIILAASATVFIGNTFFGVWADIKSLKPGRRRNDPHMTALPHGINTVVFFAFLGLIIVPEMQRTGDPVKAYHAGLFACFTLGLLELPCVFLVRWMQRTIPRAAMMSAMAGVSVTFITMTFASQIFGSPSIALLPLTIILVGYGSLVKLPLKIPAGALALLFGTLIAWTSHYLGYSFFLPSDDASSEMHASSSFPPGTFRAVFSAFFDSRSWGHLPTILPMLMINIVTSLSCVESAKAVGDDYDSSFALLSDAVLTMIGALLGNPFPTCIYIGHPAFKAMGAKTGYNYINGTGILLLGIFNGASYLIQVVPEVCGVGIILWIGVTVTSQAFTVDVSQEESAKNHSAAVVLGLVPALAAWALQQMEAMFAASVQTLPGAMVDIELKNGDVVQGAIVGGEDGGRVVLGLKDVMNMLEKDGVFVHGLVALSAGYLLSSVYLASALVHIIEREFFRASAWFIVAAALSFVGAVHSFTVDDAVVSTSFGFPARGYQDFPLQFALMYFCAAVLLVLLGIRESDRSWRAWGLKLSKFSWTNLWTKRAGPRGKGLKTLSSDLSEDDSERTPILGESPMRKKRGNMTTYV